MTVTAPPRPSDPVDREELEALVEALIEEARRRARRRRRIYGAVAALVALVGITLVTVLERSAQSQNASINPLGQSPPARATRRIASVAGSGFEPGLFVERSEYPRPYAATSL